MGAELGGTAQKVHQHLCISLERLLKAPAKPQQKLWGLINTIIPQLLYPLINTKATKGQLERMDRAIRRWLRSCLHLPKDTPVSYIHAATLDGGIGVPSLATRIPRLVEDLYDRLRGSPDPIVRLAMEGWSETVQRPMTPGHQEPMTSGQRRSLERDQWSCKLYEAIDGSGLRGAHQTPSSSRWVGDGTLLLKGGDFVRGLKLRGNLLHTKTRAARGRTPETVLCDLCHRRPETLGHILQRCSEVQGPRIGRHDKIVSFTICQLERAGYQVLKEPAITTTAGLRYPDIVAWKPGVSYILDAQVVADAACGDLNECHQRKATYYSTPDVVRRVRELTGSPPIISTITASWRGILAKPTVNTWEALGLRKQDLNIIVARVLEGGIRIYQQFQRTSGGPRHHPG